MLENFFDIDLMRRFAPLILRAFVVNIKLMLVAEAIVLVWALVIALARVAPGTAGRPLRWLAVVYVDFFRGVPLILLIFLVGFGLPISNPGVFGGVSLFWLTVIALSLGYGAYVAEVYRAGIVSIHPGQMAAARALGLTYPQAMRHVVLPQAVRRVTPPLLNDFVSLQKDTALASVIGVTEALKQSSINAGNVLNASPIVFAGLLFVLITIPLARLVDHLMERDARRFRAGAF